MNLLYHKLNSQSPFGELAVALHIRNTWLATYGFNIGFSFKIILALTLYQLHELLHCFDKHL